MSKDIGNINDKSRNEEYHNINRSLKNSHVEVHNDDGGQNDDIRKTLHDFFSGSYRTSIYDKLQNHNIEVYLMFLLIILALLLFCCMLCTNDKNYDDIYDQL